jgi:hypothetical protein
MGSKRSRAPASQNLDEGQSGANSSRSRPNGLSVKLVRAKPVARLECLAKTSTGPFRVRKRRDSATGSEDLRRRGRSLGTRFDEIISDSERGNQKSLFLGPPISGCGHQGRMQKRLSARSSSIVESLGSGGRFDSGLSRCAGGPLHRKSFDDISVSNRVRPLGGRKPEVGVKERKKLRIRLSYACIQLTSRSLTGTEKTRHAAKIFSVKTNLPWIMRTLKKADVLNDRR